MIFVEDWNCHRIRKQKNRPNSVPGIPRFNYLHAEVERYGFSIDEEFAKDLMADFEEWGT
jgi:hypothetical protein